MPPAVRAGGLAALVALVILGVTGVSGPAASEQPRRGNRSSVEKESVSFPYLGLQVADEHDLSAEARARLPGRPVTGAVVVDVAAGGPAARAGLEVGDVITVIDGDSVAAATDVAGLVADRAVGSKVKLEYLRRGERRSSIVTLGELPSEGPTSVSDGDLGLGLQTMSPGLARSLGLELDAKGAVVAEALDGRPAAQAGLQPGDVIVEIDGKVVNTAEQAARQLVDRREHQLRVRNASGSRLVTFPAVPR